MAYQESQVNRQTQTQVAATNKVLRNTYGLLAMTLLFSAITAGAAVALGVQQMNILVFFIGAYGLMFLVHKTANSALGLLATFAFTGFMGFTLGPILSAYLTLSNGPELIMTALGMTGLTFFGLSAVALITRKDFSFLANFMMAGAIVLILAMVAALIFNIPSLSLMVSAGFVLFSSAAILYQTSEIVHRAGETNYILATITLYVSIYNLFISLLSLLGVVSQD
ncbi:MULTISPECIES: Bax inhibitor-1/YccA family protein [Halomonas]|jgi:modulator of FtsH protease|uniref:BAX inhibitor (BI)-1/YccA family protein n=1 Tax=Halomonas litopenaei TaxID=2109328 RepID=A0ABX5ITK1_9GAMM|nr:MULTISPECIES: Bax inhibitor-1/YccA family protein [Halomonas]MBR9773087.1 Bax inhibitor-1/YccA family protein [Gammaproteobacteria bacterium]KJZ17159.1 membrane protein [Halomonas sp. S2151]MAR74301.1 BAX inhibitor (BI)-1/YccA family protein [Halomonas sp.]MBR9880153.1 Bax inhibitor-1/YccA family protein [Gammaproteobacteria bacterium]MBS8268119.1 BAX inhibitor (BI)-1/YccA family protein [Halomonas litopenaei]|tara:strand:- start:193 stop:864 length:672 start_codon:yes stop_codon:yes gene_type:complete